MNQLAATPQTMPVAPATAASCCCDSGRSDRASRCNLWVACLRMTFPLVREQRVCRQAARQRRGASDARELVAREHAYGLSIEPELGLERTWLRRLLHRGSCGLRAPATWQVSVTGHRVGDAVGLSLIH